MLGQLKWTSKKSIISDQRAASPPSGPCSGLAGLQHQPGTFRKMTTTTIETFVGEDTSRTTLGRYPVADRNVLGTFKICPRVLLISNEMMSQLESIGFTRDAIRK